jgi:hypothetical protein
MKTRAPPLSSKPKKTKQSTFEDRDAANDVQGSEARDRFRALATSVLSAPYAKVKELEEKEKGKSGRGKPMKKKRRAKKS